MTIAHLTAHVAVDALSEHAEGPLWDDRLNALVWVDQYRGIVRIARAEHPDSSRLAIVQEHDLAGPVGAIVPHAGGGWVVAAHDGFQHLDFTGRVTEIAGVLPNDGIRRRMNDGKVDPRGRFWAGSMAFDKTPGAASLYQLDGGRAREVISGVTISNGLAWVDSGRTMYYIDTPSAVVRRYAVDEAGELTGGEVAVSAPPQGGAFDGMCVDDEDCLWIAMWGAGEVRRYSPNGALLAAVSVGAPQVSSCAFGDEDLRTLFITTSAEGYGPVESAAHPLAGAVFAVRPGPRGRPADRYLSVPSRRGRTKVNR